MHRFAFKMKLFKGCEEGYKRRHNHLWPDLKLLLEQASVKEYSIFLDEESRTLFGYLTTNDTIKFNLLKDDIIMQKWWVFMKDFMETNDDNSPVTINLKDVFYLAQYNC